MVRDARFSEQAMTDAPLCVVCSKPILPGDRRPDGEDLHATCDRRRRVRETVKCIVCNEPIRSRDGVARLGDVLVHGKCYVRARQPEPKPTDPDVTAPSVNGSARDDRWANRLLRRVFGSRTAAGSS